MVRVKASLGESVCVSGFPISCLDVSVTAITTETINFVQHEVIRVNDRHQSRWYVLLITFCVLVCRLSGQGPSSPSGHDGEPGYYRIMVGQYEVTALSDGTVPYPMDQLLTGTTPTAVDTALASFFVSEPYPTSINCFLVNTGSRLILIDTGAGMLLGPTLGKLISNLRASGYAPSQTEPPIYTSK